MEEQLVLAAKAWDDLDHRCIDTKEFFAVPFNKREEIFFKTFPEGVLLKEKLLTLGGNRIVWLPREPHLLSLVKEGKEFDLTKRKMVKGKDGQCHTNTANLFLNKDISITTGYALRDDGVWIQHSWGFDGKQIIETTLPFEKYFGVSLTGMKITMFVFSEFGDKLSYEQMLKLPMPK